MNEEATPDDFAKQDEDPECEFSFYQSEINLSRLEEYISIIKGTKPNRVSDEQHDNSEPYLVVSTLTGEERKYTPDTDGPKATPQDTLMIMDGSKSGRVYAGENGVIGSTMAAIHPEDTNSHYLRYFLESNFERLNSATKGSAVPHTDKGVLRSLEYPVYPPPEQRKIATVLQTLDRAIENTEEVIRQSERVQKGVNQDIFTTGYYKHSEFSNVRLGPIRTSTPKNWSVNSVSDYFDIIDGDRGKNYPSRSDFSDRGYCLFLSAINVTEDGLKFDETEFITQGKDDELGLGKLKRGDIVMTTRGTVGNFGLYDQCVAYDNVRINSGMVILRPKANTSCLKYYYHFFRSGIFQRQINATSYGTAQPQTSVTDIKKMGALEPGEDEKKRIAKSIECAVSVIQIHKKYRNKLRQIKRGLMQDLLSGEVRTHDKDIELVDSVLQHG